MRNLRSLFPLILCLLLVHLAIPPVCLGDNQEFGRTHPDLAARFANIKKIGLLPPGIRIYAVSAGGVVELRNDWTGKAKENVARAIRNLLGERLVELKVPDEDRKLTEEIDDIEGLYSAIVLTIGSSGPYAFPAKDVSAYSLGPLHDICGRWNVDALLFAYGSDEISSGGRKALALMIGAVGWEGATSRTPSGCALWTRSCVARRGTATDGGTTAWTCSHTKRSCGTRTSHPGQTSSRCSSSCNGGRHGCSRHSARSPSAAATTWQPPSTCPSPLANCRMNSTSCSSDPEDPVTSCS